jgi:hypothetical protein
LTPLFCRKWAKLSENAQLQKHAKFYSAFLATTLSYATRFWQKWGMIENVEYLGVFEEEFQNIGCTVFCIYL